MNSATMYLSNVTCLDHAYVDDKGFIIGGSLNPHFMIKGEIDEVENVVVDFSTIKKDIKNIIDDKELGFDHKLWLINDYSKYDIDVDPHTENMKIQTPYFRLSVPRNAISIMEGDSHFEPYYIERYIEDKLKQKYPSVEIALEFDMRMDYPTWAINTDLHKFRYTHGLKNSTSWGCQNIAHGHLSYITGTAEADYLDVANFALAKIANALDGRMFIWKENLSRNQIYYETERGEFSLIMEPEIEFGKAVYMEQETTIENIVSYIAEKYEKDLKAAHIHSIYVSEGLNKGAVVEV